MKTSSIFKQILATAVMAAVPAAVSADTPEHLYIVGEAVGNWELDQAQAFEREDNSDVYTLTLHLGVGIFKFPTNNETWEGNLQYGPDSNDYVDLYKSCGTATPMHSSTQDPGCWYSNQSGTYKLTADFANKTFEAELVSPDAVYVIGTATTAGWTIADALEMTKDSDGNFSVKTALMAGKDTEGNDYMFHFVTTNTTWECWVFGPGTDTSWTDLYNEWTGLRTEWTTDPGNYVPTESGEYILTINPRSKTINIVKNLGTGIVSATADAKNKNIYSIDGRRMRTSNLEELPAGIYIVDGQKKIVN